MNIEKEICENLPCRDDLYCMITLRHALADKHVSWFVCDAVNDMRVEVLNSMVFSVSLSVNEVVGDYEY